MQYTGLNECSPDGPPTYACEGLGHGFGLGTGTAAEGWIYDAIAFREAHIE